MEEIEELTETDTICCICYAEFLDIDDLQTHIKQNHLNESNKRRFCKLCTILFPSVEDYALHIRDQHLRNFKVCKYCTRAFKSLQDLFEHEKKHKAAENLSCSQCDFSTSDKGELELHECNEHFASDEGFVFNHCFSILSSLLNMNVRRFFEMSCLNLIYTCAMCKMSTNNIDEYIHHLIEKPHYSLSCDQCYNVYKNKYRLRRHIEQHTKEKFIDTSKSGVLCGKCENYFTKRDYKTHFKDCIGRKCVMCQITFDTLEEYTSHVASKHTKTMTLPLTTCKYCQKQYVGDAAMDRHIERTHKNNIHLYKYRCITCDKIFKHPKFLFAHFFTQHKDLRPYVCKICNKDFRLRKNFTLHIKLDHKSVGFVEFDDNFHVFFTDKRSNKTLKSTDSEMNEKSNNVDDNATKITENEIPKDKNVTYNNSDTDNEQKHNENNSLLSIRKTINEKLNSSDDYTNASDNVNETEGEATENKSKDTKRVLKRRRNIKTESTRSKKPKIQLSNNTNADLSSDDSDTPLLKVREQNLKCKRRRRQWNKVSIPRKKAKNNFICQTCNKNCYTYLNYHQHISLHMAQKYKSCVKCNETFVTKRELKNHMESMHLSSQLTDTLKKVLERRKNINTNKVDVNTPQITAAEKFVKTIKKVEFDKSYTPAAISLVNKDKLSVKKFLENFTPEANSNANKITVSNSVSMKCVKSTEKSPKIKLTKFTPEPIYFTKPKLCMPQKFEDDKNEKHKVTIKFITNPIERPNIPCLNYGDESSSHFNNVYRMDHSYFEENNDINSHDYDDEIQPKADSIPEVAHEVMLEGTEEIKPKVLKQTIVLKDMVKYKDVRIGHLQAQAPFYKIVKMDDVLQNNGAINTEQPEITKSEDITLPNGTRLVNVNPLAHLLGNTKIDQVGKKKYQYQPRVRDAGEAIAKALSKLDAQLQKKKTKKK